MRFHIMKGAEIQKAYKVYLEGFAGHYGQDRT